MGLLAQDILSGLQCLIRVGTDTCSLLQLTVAQLLASARVALYCQ